MSQRTTLFDDHYAIRDEQTKKVLARVEELLAQGIGVTGTEKKKQWVTWGDLESYVPSVVTRTVVRTTGVPSGGTTGCYWSKTGNTVWLPEIDRCGIGIAQVYANPTANWEHTLHVKHDATKFTGILVENAKVDGCAEVLCRADTGTSRYVHMGITGESHDANNIAFWSISDSVRIAGIGCPVIDPDTFTLSSMSLAVYGADGLRHLVALHGDTIQIGTTDIGAAGAPANGMLRYTTADGELNYYHAGWHRILTETGDLYWTGNNIPALASYVYTTNSSAWVGIGLSTPTTNFSVKGAGATRAGQKVHVEFIDTTDYATDVGAKLVLTGYYRDGYIGRFGAIHGGKENATSGNYASYLRFFTRVHGSGLAEQMRITSAGHVGIGETSPATNARLHAKWDHSAHTAILVENATADGYAELKARNFTNDTHHISVGVSGRSSAIASAAYVYVADDVKFLGVGNYVSHPHSNMSLVIYCGDTGTHNRHLVAMYGDTLYFGTHNTNSTNPAAGMLRWNNGESEFDFYDGANWLEFVYEDNNGDAYATRDLQSARYVVAQTGYYTGASAGCTASFRSFDLETVTVRGGIVTSVI